MFYSDKSIPIYTELQLAFVAQSFKNIRQDKQSRDMEHFSSRKPLASVNYAQT